MWVLHCALPSAGSTSCTEEVHEQPAQPMWLHTKKDIAAKLLNLAHSTHRRLS